MHSIAHTKKKHCLYWVWRARNLRKLNENWIREQKFIFVSESLTMPGKE